MTTVADILSFVETLAPRAMKMDWDNVGLLCGSRTAPVTKILVALDPFEHVCAEAARWGAQLIVTHHPMIFRPLSSVTDETSIGRGMMTLIRSGISAVNAHTNLDQAPGGVNDVLAKRLALVNVEVLNPCGTTENGESWGLLRMGEVPEQPLDAFLNRVKTLLGCEALRYVNGGKPVRKVCVGGGSCADGMHEAIAAGCDTFVTSDIKYNQFRTAFELGLNLIDAGHFHTENPTMPILARKLREAFPEATVVFSANHTDCMNFFL